MIKNVIFDFGNVIAEYEEQRILGAFYDSEEDRRFISPIIMEDWALLDAGAVEYDDYIEKTLSRTPDRLRQATLNFFSDWYKHMPYVKGIKELIFKLKDEGYKIYLLSNAPSFFSKNAAHFDILSQFDGIIISGDVKLAKPDHRIYRLLLEQFALKAEECVFADDKEDNIRAARECGIDGYLFKNDSEGFYEYIKKGGSR